MKYHIWGFWVLFLVASPAHAAQLIMRTRTIEIDPTTPVLQARVISAPSRWTTISLPEEYVSVMCGNCIDIEEKMDVETAKKDPRRWFINKNAGGPSLHIQPLELPSSQMLPKNFSTDIYVVLKGGYRINLQVQLVEVDLTKDDQIVADSVVTIMAADSVLLSGRMREEIKKINEERENRKPQEHAEVLAENLMGIRECKTVHWKIPYRKDKTVVRLQQLCATNGETSRAFWAVFSVENLDDARLYLDSASLEEVSGATASQDVPLPDESDTVASQWDEPPKNKSTLQTPPRVGRASRFGRADLRREEATSGIAVTTLDSQEPVPSEWKLVVRPHSSDREAVEITGIRY